MESSRPVSVLKVQIFLLLRSLTLLLRSVFLSEDGRKMGRWRCPARVTALLLCKGWQEGDAEKEEEQLLLAGDVQVTFEAFDVLMTFLYFLCRVVSGNMEEMVPPLSPPLSPARSHPCVFTQVPSCSSMSFLFESDTLQSSLSPSCFLMSSCSSCLSMSLVSCPTI